MIRVDGRGDAVVLWADLPAGALAYLDREWLLGRPDTAVPALVVGPAGEMSWSGQRSVITARDGDPDIAALAALTRLPTRPCGPSGTVTSRSRARV